MKPATDTGQIKFRLPLALKTWVQEQADASKRSLTAEIVLHLEQARDADKAPKKAKG